MSTSADIEPFEKTALLSRINPDDLRQLVRHATERTFGKGEALFHRGDAGDSVYIIASGSVKILLDGADGAELVVAQRNAGTTLGEFSLIDGLERSATAVANERVRTLRISRDHFREWLMQHPEASWQVMEELTRRLRESTDLAGEIALLPVEARIARRLAQIFSMERGGASPANGTPARVNQTALAASLGLTRETVNKHIAKMKTQGIVQSEGVQLVLRDAKTLQELANPV
jgi:CRP-like cAMP-binding protein